MRDFNDMDIRIIAFGMLFVLAALFIGARFFVPKEKENSRYEADFAQAAIAFKQNPNKDNFQKCLEASKKLSYLKGKSQDDILQYLSSQGITLS